MALEHVKAGEFPRASDYNDLVDTVIRLRDFTYSNGIASSGGRNAFKREIQAAARRFEIFTAALLGIDPPPPDDPPPGSVGPSKAMYMKRVVDDPANPLGFYFGEDLVVFPDFGHKAEDYRSLIHLGDPKVGFLKVQRIGDRYRAWFPGSDGSPIFHAVIRGVRDPFGEIVDIQRVYMDASGVYHFLLDDNQQNVIVPAVVPPAMLARDFRAYVVPTQFQYHSAVNVIKIYRVDGIDFAEQTTKFTFEALDPGFNKTDCVMQAAMG